MITKESIDHLKSSVDIVDVIGRYIEIKKAGASYKALCPFHSEKTPSFHISPVKQICHCYSCGAGGDAIRFVQEYEKISFAEAVEKIASMYNITLDYTAVQKSRPKVLEGINRFYVREYDRRGFAREYVASRGIHAATAEKFELGYAPTSAETIAFLKQNFFTSDEAIEAGVLGSDGERIYARQSERITFPIYNASGSMVIGFGGRTLGNHPAKYINSPQTPFFNKSQVLYAYHLAREAIHARHRLIVTEGYLDVIMLHQAGFTEAVATLGTALTKEHFPLLRRGEPAIIMAYDGDNAGRNAAFKGAQLLLTGGFRGGVILFDGGLDPADMVKAGRIEELERLFEHPIAFIPFILRTLASQYDLKLPDQKERALAAIQQFLLTLSPLAQEEYKGEAALLLGINPRLIKTASARRGAPREAPRAPAGESLTIDRAEAQLLKTALTHPPLIDRLLELGADEIFLERPDLFERLLRDGNEADIFRPLLFDDTVMTLETEEELRKAVLYQKEKFVTRRLERIRQDASLSMQGKVFAIRRCHDAIARLKRGEMVLASDFIKS